MFDRPDAVLVAIPLLAVSGIGLRTVILSTGAATGLLTVPLAPAGVVAAASVMLWEVFTGPATGTDGRQP